MADHNISSGPFMALGPGEAVGNWTMYRWIPVAGSFIMFGWACMIGANDVATSFGTSIGSGALTMMQAVFLALVMEITGAVFQGSRVVDPLHLEVIKEGPHSSAFDVGPLHFSDSSEYVVYPSSMSILGCPATPSSHCFQSSNPILALCAAIWLALATHWELPVTSILTLWGALIGISLTTQGFDGVYWTKEGSPFFVGGTLGIFASWFLAPFVAGVITFLFFGFLKFILLRAQDPERRAVRAIPIYYGITVTVLIFFILHEATPETTLKEIGNQRGALISILSGVVSVVLSYLIFIPSLQKRLSIEAKEKSLASQIKSGSEKQEDIKSEEVSSPVMAREMTAEDYLQQFNELRCLDTVPEGDEEACQSGQFSSIHSIKRGPLAEGISLAQLFARTPSTVLTFKHLRTLSRKQSFQTKTKDYKTMGVVGTAFEQKLEHDQITQVMHARAERFCDKVEELFSFLCILTACITAFSHGSNELAAATGPYTQILYIYENGSTPSDQITEGWILAFAALGVCLGFALLGWRIVRCLGGRLTFLSPSRAFSAQLCTLATVLIASETKIPYSTTHILIGALVGVGISDNYRNVNWYLFLRFLMGWVATLLFTGGLSSAIFSFTTFSPAYSIVQN